MSKEDNKEIKTDFYLLRNLFFDLIKYLFLLIPRLFVLIYNLILFRFEEVSKVSPNIFIFPFKVIKDIISWFYQAKYTFYISILLIFMFLFQIIYLNSSDLLNSIMTNPIHFYEGNFHSTLTSIFIHANVFHLISNLIALNIFGRIVEREFKGKILWIFLVSGVVSNVISNSISYFQSNFFFSLGASGAIAGLIVLAILISPFSLTTLLIVPLPIFVIGWFLIILDIIGLTNPSTVNHLAHLGGYMALVIIYYLVSLHHRKKLLIGFLLNMLVLVFLYILINLIEIGDINLII